MSDADAPGDELIGYIDRWSVKPGEKLGFRVSTTAARYEAALLRLRHGSEAPEGPGFRATVIPGVGGSFAGRRQLARCGSCAITPPSARLAALDCIAAVVWFYPTLGDLDGRQGLISTLERWGGPGWCLYLEGRRLRLTASDGDGTVDLCAPVAPDDRSWQLAYLEVDRGAEVARLFHGRAAGGDWVEAGCRLSSLGSDSARVLIGAAARQPPPGSVTWADGHFNGKIAAPAILPRRLVADELAALRREGALGEEAWPLASWDFAAARGEGHDVALDRGPDGLHTRLINLPARAMVDHRWTGGEDERSCRSAIHFHDDDLGDAGWEVDFEIELPPALPSGVYAAELRSADGELEDHVPFIVRPGATQPRAPVALVLPTLTYLAYANKRFDEGFAQIGMTAGAPTPSAADEWLAAHPELGASLYDRHSDGSGWCYSSRLRPIPNLRPKARHWTNGLPRHLAADLYIVDWLETLEVRYDVFADEDLHAGGQELLAPYRVVLTGTHPEYCTGEMRAGLDAYLGQGGRLMYLGGNGFYWVTSLGPDSSFIEVRRGYAGTRPWTSEPLELRHSTTGETGGLWRHRGLPPNELVGVGFAAEGFDSAPGFTRTPRSYEPDVAWVFDGVDDEVIGDFGLHLGGAGGDEIDSYDRSLGSPPEAVVIATATSHSSAYAPAIENVPHLTPRLLATGDGLVRADMVFWPRPGGGAVFSVSAISWCGALSHNGYSNSVARVSENVLRGFSDPRPVVP